MIPKYVFDDFTTYSTPKVRNTDFLSIPFFKEPFEACHKRIRMLRAQNARCRNDKFQEDVLHRLMLESDPDIRSYKKESFLANFPFREIQEDDFHPDVILMVVEQKSI